MSDSLLSNTNRLLCDIETGSCEIAMTDQDFQVEKFVSTNKPIKIIYFTDPICSSCWAIEPQLRKLKLEYGHVIHVEYRMGGLLPDWSYNSGGISKPSDVAKHWDEVSKYYDMPIDGDIWLEDPLYSSFPPSIAFKAAELQSIEKSVRLLRELREMVFLKKRNITKWEHIEEAAIRVNLDPDKLKKDFRDKATLLFHEDLELAKQLGVRGFPTLFFADGTGIQEKVYGSKPYVIMENAILKIQPHVLKNKYDINWINLFQHYPTQTSREFAELTEMKREESDLLLEKLYLKRDLQKTDTKNGAIWSKL